MLTEMPYYKSDIQYQGILEYCRNEGWTVLENQEKRIVSIHISDNEISGVITVRVQEDLERISLRTCLPVIVRPENEERTQQCLQNLNDMEHNRFGHFRMDGKRIAYVYAYSYAGQKAFHKEPFSAYIYECFSVPYQKADEILDVATEHLNIPEPVRNPFWDDFKIDLDDDWLADDLKAWGENP